ncbi:Copper resistance B precursor, partial [mine drainage metagenome]
FWDSTLGVRHDFGNGPGRNWAAFGVQGLAPYWFDIEATGYVGAGGRTAARFKAEYELLITQRLILQPEFEANLYGKPDPAWRLGSGLSDASLGLRLRYEIRREFAPYIGVVWQRVFGGTADLRRAEGNPCSTGRSWPACASGFEPALAAPAHARAGSNGHNGGLRSSHPQECRMSHQRISAHLGLALAAVMIAMPALAAAPLRYPVAQRDNIVNNYFGDKVPAPYQWMENL